MGVVAKELAENHNFLLGCWLSDVLGQASCLVSLWRKKKKKRTKKISKFVLNLGKNDICPSFLGFS